MQIIDAWVNADMPRAPAAWQREVAEGLFKTPAESIFRRFSAEELIDNMDEAGVQKAILLVHADRPNKSLLAYAEKYPHRFAFSALLDPRRGMVALRQLDGVLRSHEILLARVIPSLYEITANDRVCYPLYAKCVELGLPISINTGIPGPPLPAKYQDPMSLDDVCLFFPELRIVMANGADPWWQVATSLMAKHKNLYLMTSGYAPKYLPLSLVQFMNTRGQDKVMFASDFPFLTMHRCAEEARQLDLRPGVLDKFFHANAARVLVRGPVATSSGAEAPQAAKNEPHGGDAREPSAPATTSASPERRPS